MLLFAPIVCMAAPAPLLRFDGFGSATIGMSTTQVGRALGRELIREGEPNVSCEYSRPVDSPSGPFLMFVDGRLARIDVGDSGIPTVAGVKVGDSIAKVKKVYAGRYKITPHQYLDWPEGKYVTVRESAVCMGCERKSRTSGLPGITQVDTAKWSTLRAVYDVA